MSTPTRVCQASERGDRRGANARKRHPTPYPRLPVLDLQSRAGNDAVRRLVETSQARSRVVQRATPIADEKDLESDLLSGDSRLQSAHDNNPPLTPSDPVEPVRLMQKGFVQVGYPMPNSTDPSGELDGRWGQETRATVRQFQTDNGIPPGGHEAGRKTLSALDRLLPKGGPPPGKEPLDPELEGILDRIVLAYDRMLIEQMKGVSDLEKDLRTTEKAQPSIAGRVLNFLAQQVVNRVLGTDEKSLRSVALAIASDLPEKIKSNAIADRFEDARKTASEAVAREINPTNEGEVLSSFIAGQNLALAEANLATHENFLTVTKPELRKPQAGDENTPAIATDPRLVRAARVLNAVDAASRLARQRQYNESLDKWVLANAQQTLNVDPFQGGVVPGPTDVTKLRVQQNEDKHDVPGVLEIDFRRDPADPKVPAVVTGMSIAGLSELARTRINRDRSVETIGGLNYPRRAWSADGDLVIAKNEVGTVDASRTVSPADETWFAAKGGGNPLAGMDKLYSEIDEFTVAQVGGMRGP